MTQVSVHEAKTNLSRLIASALAGEEVVIARGNIPAVRLVPVNPVGERKFGALKGAISVDAAFFDPLPADELDGWDFP
ncbi:type II toxin-antitoxin system Phd/YefM family antitoxin [Novosphingobium kaempferiae]|uniref:type II toxin-antitoxin system Phd/YefM family antitoxin n=1 Tax=Novosphingobium kaempferiae TaxID=2896849 RepID=UPI001E5AF630|nr:type II toxin-antitoxin system Phd/YefM family antitoxin [Novosphingobium kaempferiae]